MFILSNKQILLLKKKFKKKLKKKFKYKKKQIYTIKIFISNLF